MLDNNQIGIMLYDVLDLLHEDGRLLEAAQSLSAAARKSIAFGFNDSVFESLDSALYDLSARVRRLDSKLEHIAHECAHLTCGPCCDDEEVQDECAE